ncbi:hypothetical protein SAMN05192574_11049 [Mucilaginibacter gossypiicola]|uniref:Uncharacterized protein n=1 Tax=Mucilaginibacter gossypiicola TaxID=551995 RepID=A0A1H8R9Q6_9SPHI|nr:hypothetical protein SAMN05192574_11049 [Mucilaginibacter gossypiicola]
MGCPIFLIPEKKVKFPDLASFKKTQMFHFLRTETRNSYFMKHTNNQQFNNFHETLLTI